MDRASDRTTYKHYGIRSITPSHQRIARVLECLRRLEVVSCHQVTVFIKATLSVIFLEKWGTAVAVLVACGYWMCVQDQFLYVNPVTPRSIMFCAVGVRFKLQHFFLTCNFSRSILSFHSGIESIVL